MEASRRRRRRRSLPGNGTQAEAEVEGEDDLEQECAINAPGMGLGLKNIDPDQPGMNCFCFITAYFRHFNIIIILTHHINYFQ